MFKIFLLLTGLIISFSQAAWTNDSDRAIDQKVHRLLSQMTLEEKVGQMTQLNVDVVSAGKDGLGEPHMLDDAKLIDILIDHHVGSILNVTSDSDRHHWFTAEHWQEVIRKIQEVAVHKSRLGIPVIYGIDGIHGATFTEGATLFPQAIGMAATFNPELLTKEGEVTSREIKASGIPWNFAPVVDASDASRFGQGFMKHWEKILISLRLSELLTSRATKTRPLVSSILRAIVFRGAVRIAHPFI